MRLTLLICSSLILLTFSGCQNDPITPNGNVNLSGNSFTLKKDGVSYTPQSIVISWPDEDALSIETYMNPNSVTDNTYAVLVKRSITPGTYTLSEDHSEYFSIYHIQDEETMFGWDHGTMTVISNDTVSKIMHCTFSATLYNDEIDLYPEITDGEFTIHY